MRLILLLCVLLLSPLPALAQFPSVSLPCGGAVTPANQSSPVGVNGWLEFTVTTSSPPNICTRGMSVTGRVAGISGSQVSDYTNWWAVSVRRQVPAPYSGNWVTEGDHYYYLAFPLPPSAFSAGRTQSHVWISVQTNADACSQQGAEYYWDGSNCIYQPGSPLLIDVDRKGFKLTEQAEGVLFDIDGDGRVEQVSWTAADAEDAWLALDRNGNGIIDSGQELFGTATPVGLDPLSASGYSTTFNGFEVLLHSEIEGAKLGSLSTDKMITPADPIWGALLLWTDRNHNGFSEADELQSATAAGLSEISLTYHEIGKRDRHGNTFAQTATMKWADGKSGHIYDVWLMMPPQ